QRQPLPDGARSLRGGFPRARLLRHAAGEPGGNLHLADRHSALLRVLPADAVVFADGQDQTRAREADVRNEIMRTMKALAALLLLVPALAFAADVNVKLDRAPIDPSDQASLQRGAHAFVNYCLNCHSASYMRYNRLQDIGLTEEQIRDNLIF